MLAGVPSLPTLSVSRNWIVPAVCRYGRLTATFCDAPDGAGATIVSGTTLLVDWSTKLTSYSDARPDGPSSPEAFHERFTCRPFWEFSWKAPTVPGGVT